MNEKPLGGKGVCAWWGWAPQRPCPRHRFARSGCPVPWSSGSCPLRSEQTRSRNPGCIGLDKEFIDVQTCHMYLEANLVNDGHFIFSHLLVGLRCQWFLLYLSHLQKEFLGAFLVFSLTILVFSVLNLCFEFVLVNLCFEFKYLSWLPTNNGVLAGLWEDKVSKPTTAVDIIPEQKQHSNLIFVC